MRPNTALTALLLVLNIGFISWVLVRSGLGKGPPGGAPAAGPGAPEPPPHPPKHGDVRDAPEAGRPQTAPPPGDHRPPPGGPATGDPIAHLPLAGMPKFAGSRADACDRLAGFMINAYDVLEPDLEDRSESRGVVAQLLNTTRCTMGEAPVRVALETLATRWAAAGREPLPPFALLNETFPEPDDILQEDSQGPRAGAPSPTDGGGPQATAPGPSGPGHDQSDMFPIAGMPDYTGGAADACPTLERFVRLMNKKLDESGIHGPVDEHTLGNLVAQGRCSLDDNRLRATLEPYRRAFWQAGLKPLPPFGHLDPLP